MTQSSAVPAWLGMVGIGSVLCWRCARWIRWTVEPTGWKLAAALTPVTYIVWSLWLVAVGVFLLL
jgi:hypothetical protein